MNRLRSLFPLTAAVLLASLASLPSLAVEVEVTIENLAPADGNLLTPVWVGFHDGTFDSYDGGAPLRGTVERIAEDGDTVPLTDEFALDFGTPQGTIPGPNGPIFPGDTATMIFDLDADADRYFSYVSMVIPSNDAFVANGNPLAHRVFDVDGNFTPTTFVIHGGDVLDAGTEVNDEIPANTAAFGQMAPDTGVVENGVVTPHPGFLPAGSGGILDDARFAGATFRDPGYRIARISVRAVRGTTVRFSGSGDDARPNPVTTDATAACSARLASDEASIAFSCQHDVADVRDIYVGRGGARVFTFDDTVSPIAQTFDVDADLAGAFVDGELYIDFGTDDHPEGEIRADVEGCFSGPASLCLYEDRFQISATFETATNDGDAKGFELTEDSGVFYFFRPGNIELDVKVLNGCGETGFFWFFAAGLTNQGVVLTVLDTRTGVSRQYENPLDRPFVPILDTRALDSCP